MNYYFFIYLIFLKGSCDCGNIHAWNPKGACSDHTSKDTPTPDDPSASLPADVRIKIISYYYFLKNTSFK